ncbi:b906e79f-4f2c-44af-b454-3f538bb034c3 [Thermothielavioides terrestris]|uniref:Store-operated calcium entry-associated regulatory factor n=1 Tax=Thermothielavioides terrestris TaxID=2587410 RepID=A0A3S4APM7_9PEZI|nr:b906e79f-4f2c-44af-b454-3f538bb034c3 [Thermothielavioides terrestris]
MPTSLLLLSFLTLASLPAVTLAARPKNAILLSEVQSLTLHANRKTTSRRVPAIPQLRCTSAPALCRLADVRTLRCTNQGASYTAQDVEWACTAPGGLPAAVRLDATKVICEGYESADDAYVLRGSCGVEYTLRLTEEGARQYPELARLGGGGIDWTDRGQRNDNERYYGRRGGLWGGDGGGFGGWGAGSGTGWTTGRSSGSSSSGSGARHESTGYGSTSRR